MDQLATELDEWPKELTVMQEEVREMQQVVPEDCEVEQLRRKISEMNVEMMRKTAIYVRDKIKWEKEREQLQKELENCKSLLQNCLSEAPNQKHDCTMCKIQYLTNAIEHGSTTAKREEILAKLVAVEKARKAIAINKREQTIRKEYELECKESKEPPKQEEPEQKVDELVAQSTTMEVQKTAETLHNKLNASDHEEKASTSDAPEPQLQTRTPTGDRIRKQLQKRFMSWLENHDCKDLNCTVVAFRNNIKHATHECFLSRGYCTWYICQRINFKTEHLKACNDRLQCKFCQPYVYFDETKLTGLMALLDNGCPLNPESSKLNKDASMNMAARLVVSYGLVDEKTDDSESSLSSTHSESSYCSSSSDSSSDYSPTSDEKISSEEWEIVESDIPTEKVNWMDRLKRSIHLRK